MKSARLYLLMLAILYSVTAIGQSHEYRQGTITAADGSTKTGFILTSKMWGRKGFIEFKSEENAAAVRYYAREITRVDIPEGDKIITASLDLNVTQTENGELVFGSQAIYRHDTIFLQTMISGPYTLYTHVDERPTRHFFLETESEGPKELIYYRYKTGDENNPQVRENNLYRKQLSDALSDCESVLPLIQEAGYSQKALTRIIREANISCKGMVAVELFEKKPERPALNLELYGGMGIGSSIFYKGQYRYELIDMEMSPNPTVVAGANLLLTPSVFRRKISFGAGASYFQIAQTGYWEEQHSQDFFESVSLDFQAEYIGLDFFVRLTGHSKLAPYVQAGATFGKLIETRQETERLAIFLGAETLSNDDYLYEPAFGDVGGALAIGIHPGRFSAQLKARIGYEIFDRNLIDYLIGTYIGQFTVGFTL